MMAQLLHRVRAVVATAATLLATAAPLAGVAQDRPQSLNAPSDAQPFPEPFRVQVLGAVTRPGNIQVTEGDRLSTALARAGVDAVLKPDLTRVWLTRYEPKSREVVAYQVNLARALLDRDVRYDPLLRKDDRIFVPDPSVVNRVMIAAIGAVGRSSASR